ncbi:MAG: MoaD/ThiS family protein [Nitrososphaeraceae archaeon]
MITLRLLGGVRNSLGKNIMQIDKPNVTIKNILTLLNNSKKDNGFIDENNLMIALNGVDIEMLEGNNTVAKSGDTVTIVTIVHGG